VLPDRVLVLAINVTAESECPDGFCAEWPEAVSTTRTPVERDAVSGLESGD
jgi:hypothetical protein